MKVIKTGAYKNLFFLLGGTVLLVTFYFLSIVNRRNIAKHMCFMIAAALVFRENRWAHRTITVWLV